MRSGSGAIARPSRHLRRAAAVFTGSLIAHALTLGLVATRSVTPPLPTADATQTATPIILAPPPRPTPKKPAAKHQPPRPPAAIAARQPVPNVAPIHLADAGQLAAPITPLGDDPGGAGKDATNSAAPPDLTAATPPPGHYPINPGYWQVAEHWLLLSRTERYCVEPWNITTFMAAPCNHLYHCDYPVQRIDDDGHFHFSGVIWRHDERYNVSGGGLYSPTRLHLAATGAGHFRFLPFAFSASLDGQYLGAICPPDAKRIHQGQPPQTGVG